MSAFALEVAVCSVTDPDSFSPLQRQTHENLAGFDGFVAGTALRGVEDASVRADLIVWSTPEAAAAAAQTIQKDERFAGFMQAIDKVRHFAHYTGVTPDTLAAVAKAPVVEVAAYAGVGEAPMEDLQAQVHRALESLDGSVASARGRRDGDDGLVLLDLIGWRDPSASAAAPATLQEKHPELAPFFAGVGEMTVFEMFEVLR